MYMYALLEDRLGRRDHGRGQRGVLPEAGWRRGRLNNVMLYYII